jgi:signal transduction histidine kinase
MAKSTKSKIPRPADHIAELEHGRLTSLINSMADGVIATDENLVVAIYNGAALNILDINIELKGKHIGSFIKLVDRNNQVVNTERLVKKTTTQLTTRDLLLEYPNGESINLYLSIAPVHLGFGITGQRGFVLLLRDITREKSLEEERDEFISVVSHELRTPIAIAEGNISNVQFLAKKEPNIPSGINKALKAAYEQIAFLSGMINDLATLSRAERGKLNVDIESINAYDLVNEISQNYGKDAKAKGIEIVVKADPELQLLQSSKLYVREILQNFVTNAIKYTEKGKVTITAKPKPDGVMFEVSDTGIGISKADKEKVFDKFFRSEDYRTRQSSGTGLGLYVTLKLANLIHAEIDLNSEINKGSTFTIFIPNLK